MSGRDCRLGDIADVSWGDTKTTKASYVPEGYRAFSAKGQDGYLPHFDYSEPGVVVSAIGAQCGKVWYASGNWSCIKNTIRILAKPGVSDARYLFYAASAPGFFPNRGSAQPFIAQSDARNIRIHLPPLEEQRRIAGVLGALDDLIEVNRGLIDDLLAATDAIAWSIESQGEVRVFSDVCDVFGGGTPSTKTDEYWNGDILWATPTDMTALPSPYLFDTSRHITGAGLEACASKLMPKGSILMTSRATIGAFAIAQEPTAVNQGFIAVEPRREVDRWYLFHEMRRRVPEFIQRANGSTFLELSRGVFKSLEINWPAESVRSNLFAWVDPLHRAAASLQQEITELEATRDELLPLLMSGRVRVGEAGVAA